MLISTPDGQKVELTLPLYNALVDSMLLQLDGSTESEYYSTDRDLAEGFFEEIREDFFAGDLKRVADLEKLAELKAQYEPEAPSTAPKVLESTGMLSPEESMRLDFEDWHKGMYGHVGRRTFVNDTVWVYQTTTTQERWQVWQGAKGL